MHFQQHYSFPITDDINVALIYPRNVSNETFDDKHTSFFLNLKTSLLYYCLLVVLSICRVIC